MEKEENISKYFCLKWDNHLQNLSYVFERLYSEQKYVDVTLSCDGGNLKAHKFILSACSSYFELIFKNNPCKHPMVIMQDIKLRDMQMLLEFMYKGEINVQEDEINSFMTTASMLHVSGLDKNNDDEDDDNTSKSLFDRNNKTEHLLSNADIEEINQITSSANNETTTSTLCFNEIFPDLLNDQPHQSTSSGIDITQIKQRRIIKRAKKRVIEVPNTSTAPPNKRSKINNAKNNNNVQKPSMTMNTTTTSSDNKTECRICKMKFDNGELMIKHMQLEHNYTEDYRPHRCEYCPLAFFRSAHLKRHIRLHTGEKPFECALCSKSFARQDKLKQHLQRHGPQFVSLATVYNKTQTQQNNRQKATASSVVTNTERLLKNVQDLGECIIQTCTTPAIK